MIRFTCTECGATMKVPEEKAWRAGKCPKCGAIVRVPTADIEHPGTGFEPPAAKANVPHSATDSVPVLNALPKGAVILVGVIVLLVVLCVAFYALRNLKPEESRGDATKTAPPSEDRGPKAATRLPLMGDETSIVRIKASPHLYYDKPVVLCGGVRPANYYNWRYGGAQRTHYSLRFTEMTPDLRRIDDATIYLRRDIGDAFMDEVIAAVRRGFSDGISVRLRVVLLRKRHSSEATEVMFEVLDWAYGRADGSGWQDWERGEDPTEFDAEAWYREGLRAR